MNPKTLEALERFWHDKLEPRQRTPAKRRPGAPRRRGVGLLKTPKPLSRRAKKFSWDDF